MSGKRRRDGAGGAGQEARSEANERARGHVSADVSADVGADVGADVSAEVSADVRPPLIRALRDREARFAQQPLQFSVSSHRALATLGPQHNMDAGA